MLQAKNEAGKFITPSLLPKEKLEKIRKTQFYCPTCNGPVILRAGPKTIPHFAHRAHGNCPTLHTGESHYHKQAKLLLYKWLHTQSFREIYLEKYIPTIQQRPDILFKTERSRVAIEFQQVTTSTEEISKRNSGFTKEGIFPLWILGESLLQTYDSYRKTISLSFFQQQFIQNYLPQGPTQLIYFCPYKKRFTIIYDLLFTSQQRTLAKCRKIPLKQATLRSLFPRCFFPRNTLLSLWYKEKKTFRTSPHRVRGKEFQFRKWLYKNHLHVEQLPAIIHLPIRLQYIMEVPLWHWQTKLVLKLLHPLPKISQITLADCLSLLEGMVHPKRKEQLPQLVEEYFQYLIELKILKQIDRTTWRKVRPIRFFTYIEESLRADRLLLHYLRQNSYTYMKS